MADCPGENESLRALRDVLATAGYDGDVVDRTRRFRRYLSSADALSASLAGGSNRHSPLTTLLALFAIGEAVRCQDAERALQPLTLEQLEADGLLRIAAGHVWPVVRILPFDGLLLLGDAAAEPARDFVGAQYGSGSQLVSWLAPRRSWRSMLDLGTGSGVQALLASRHSQRVVGVDVNPRAIKFADRNARLNGVDNAEWRIGSWFEPVATERFDLVLANLPHVVSPDSEFIYRDSGQPPGELAAQLCAQAPDHLEDGGLAVLLCEWGHATEEDWDVVPRRWASDTECDGIIVCMSTTDPLEYAAAWNRPPARQLATTEMQRTIARWHAYYRDAAIGAISFGAVILRRRAGGARWTVQARTAAAPGEQAARQITRAIAGNDLLACGDDLDDRRYAVPDGLSISQRFVRRDGGWMTRVATASVPDELGVTATIDPDALPAIFRCDGTAPLADHLHSSSHPDLVRSAVRELLAHGLLEVR